MKATLLNCRFWHTYQDEDAVGSVKQIARKVHRRLLELRLLGRWLIRLGSYTQGRSNEPLRSAARKKCYCSVVVGFEGHVMKAQKVIYDFKQKSHI